jgi:hypothetical protein
MSKEIDRQIPANEGSKSKAKSKFDLKSLRISQDLEPATKPAFEYVHLGKPSKRTFFRTFLIPEQSERYSLVEDFDNELYLATPKLALELGSDTYPVCLVPFVTRDPTVGLWPIKTGNPGAKPNSWNESAYKAALVAREKWTRLQSNQTMSCYEAKVAIGEFEEPLFPEESYDELIVRAFDGRIIELSSHPVIQKLLGVL